MTKRKGWIGWLYGHGVALAYGVIMTVVLSISGLILLGVVLFASWWERIR
jgi:hypothetical protein